MTITPFGWFYLTIMLCIVVWRRAWLPGFLPLAACLHAPAVVVVGLDSVHSGYGITPWHATCLLLVATMMFPLRAGLSRLSSIPPATRGLLLGWTAFTVVGVISAFVLPLLFEGVLTYDNQEIENIAQGTKPVELRPGNAAQAGNLLVAWMVLVCGALALPQRNRSELFLNGFTAAAAVSLFLSASQRLLLVWGLDPFQVAAHSLNPGYDHVLGYLFARDGIRVGWPFSEPSYASAWFASIAISGLASWLWLGHARGILLLAAGAAGLANSFSGTGVMVALLCAAATLGLAIARARAVDRHVVARTRGFCLASLGVLALAVSVASQLELSHPNVGTRNVAEAAMEYLENRLKDPLSSEPSRWQSNVRAAEIVGETYGLGVGLGSNRASSYGFNLASNVGVLGTALFFAALIGGWRALLRLDVAPELRAILLAGGGTMFLAVNVGIPDLLWPAWWVWPIVGFWVISDADQTPRAVA